MKRNHLIVIAIVFTLLAGTSHSRAQGTAFTYQGWLTDNGAPANGAYNLRFTLYDALTGGIAIGGPLTIAPISVSNGLFTVKLDFSADMFNGANRWLGIAVRTNGGTMIYQTLSPRQQLTAIPYAVRAANFSGDISSAQLPANVARLDINQTFASANTFPNAANSFVGRLFADIGSAAAPGLAFNGDARTGLFRPATDQLAVSTKGTERMRIDNSGKVGIGTTSPLADLHIRGSGTTGMLAITPDASDSQSQILLAENTSASLGFILRYAGDVSGNPLYFIPLNSGASEGPPVLTLERNTGDVGIGTASPTAKLDVRGNISTTGSITVPATTRYYSISPAAFTSEYHLNGAHTEWAFLGAFGGFFLLAKAGGEIVGFRAPVNLPHGAVVTRFQATVGDSSAEEEITVRLNRLSLNDGNVSSMAEVVSLAIPQVTVLVDTTITGATIANNTYAYMVQAFWRVPNDGQIGISGIRIDYTVTSPLP